MRDLDKRLVAERDELLGHIHTPELSEIHGRAHRLRRRRRLAAAGSALTMLVAIGTGVALVETGDGGQRPDVAASTPTSFQSVWQGAGLTLRGLSASLLDVPGDFYDIEFADAERGYALSALCGAGGKACEVSLAETNDGGHTWVPSPLPADVTLDPLPRLVTLGDGGRVLVGASSWFAQDHEGWSTPAEPVPAAPPTIEQLSGVDRLWLRPVPGDCEARPVEAWRWGGVLGRLVHQPPMDVCWVAPAPAADGAWWVGGSVVGTLGRRPAVAVSRDSGRSWTVNPFPSPVAGSWAQVSTVGGDVYASVVSSRGGEPDPQALRLHTVYRSAARRPFTQLRGGSGTVVGDVVPLLDGRLVAAGPRWQVSEVGSADLRSTAGSSLPYVGRLERTPGGWVAYDLFDVGWAAYSRDGQTWSKINIR
jgi:hypothetical protein